MDWVAAMEIIKRYRYLLLAVLAGIALLTLSAPEKNTAPPVSAENTDPESSLEESLAKLLSMTEGAGRVEVLLTQARGEEVFYQEDEDRTAGTENTKLRTQTVLTTGSERSQSGLVRQKNPPVWLGAVVLCQGADSAQVRLSMVEAVMDATGLTSDRITVLKMK